MRDVLTVRIAVIVLGVALLLTILGGVWLASVGKTFPDALLAIGAGAAGVLGGVIAGTRPSS